MSKTKSRDHRGHVQMAKLRYKCVTGKVRFRDRREAIDALHRTQLNAERQREDFGTTRRSETRCYRCPSCRGVHLTSLTSYITAPNPGAR